MKQLITRRKQRAGALVTLSVIALLFLQTCKDKGNPIDGQESQRGKIVFTMLDTLGVDHFGEPATGSVIFRMNLDGTRLTRLTLRGEILDTFQNRPRIRGSAMEPRWSQDGKKIVYSESLGPDESHIVMMNEDGSNKKVLTPVGGYCIRPKWSPKGDRILYLRGTYIGAIIATSIVDTNGNSVDVIDQRDQGLTYEGDSVFINPISGKDWAGDNNYLYIVGSVGKRYGEPGYSQAIEIFRLEIITKKLVQRMTRNSIDESGCEISPTGTQIVFFQGPYQTDRKIYLMSVTDFVATPITTGKSDQWPRWSNDGKLIVYTKDVNDDPYTVEERIYLVNPTEPFKETRVSSLYAGQPDLFVYH